MIKDILGIRPKKGASKKPVKENSKGSVSARRFNEMIDYYTAELKSRISEIDSLKAENEMLIKTSLKNASRSDELKLQVKKLQEEVRMLQQKQRT